MSTIQPIAAKAAEKVFRANVKNGKDVAIRLTKDQGMLKTAKFFDVKFGKEELMGFYSLGKHTSPNNKVQNKAIEEISKICEKAKDGAKLFADIMDWLK